MDRLLGHWALSPLCVVGIGLLVAHELGQRALRRRSASPRTARTYRAWGFRLGCLTLVLASGSPLAWWGMQLLSVHMVDHILLMCVAPVALVAGGPIVPLVHSVPVDPRRRALRWLCRSRSALPLRSAWSFATRPIVGFLALNAAMVLWHLPAAFNAAMRYPAVHEWLMEPSFVITGVLFWRSIAPSHPFAPRARLRTQFAMVVATNFEMLVLAMSMSIFTKHAWYASMTGAMRGIPGSMMGMSMQMPFPQQQSAAAVLWICGDFWALPAIIVIVRRYIAREGSLLGGIDRTIERTSSPQSTSP